jgi:hypothetical protein
VFVLFEKDIGRELQANEPKQRDAFTMLSNIYLYATGREARRPRLATNYVLQRVKEPTIQVAAARIKWDGDFDPEPMAMPQLKAILANDKDINLAVKSLKATQLKDEQFAFLTVTPNTTLSDEDSEALRRWVNDGGTLWVDALGGSPDANLKLDDVLKKLGLKNPELMPYNDMPTTRPIGSIATKRPQLSYRPFSQIPRGRTSTLKVAILYSRPAIYVSRDDIVSGLAGVNTWGISGFTPATARQLVVTSITGALAGERVETPSTEPSTAPSAIPASATSQPTTSTAPSPPPVPRPQPRHGSSRPEYSIDLY